MGYSIAGVSIAGDCGRESGVAIWEYSGHVAALDTVFKLGEISKEDRDRFSQSNRKLLSRHQAVRPFLDRLFQPRKAWLVPEDEDTMVCCCEEVTDSEIRGAVQMGAQSPDRVKPMIRCGMRPCQTRMCGLTVSEVIADGRNISSEEVGFF